MEKYDISNNFTSRIHTIRVTFQYQEYKGHIAYQVGGNSKGLNVMNVDFNSMDIDEIENFIENDCSFKWNEEYEIYELILKDKTGNICKINDIQERDLDNYVVAVEIIDCKLEK